MLFCVFTSVLTLSSKRMHNNAHSLFYLLHFALIIVATFHCVSCSTGSSCTLIMLARPVPPVSRAGTDSRKLPQGHVGDFVVPHSDLIMLAYSPKGRKRVGKGEKWCSLRRNKKKKSDSDKDDRGGRRKERSW